MAKEKVPAFQFYPKDFLSDSKVCRMSNTEVGIYIRLICHCWLDGDLPLETEALASMAHMQLKQFTKLWENSIVKTCFHLAEDGRLHNKRLDEEREKQEAYRRRQTDAAASRWDKPKPSQPDATASPVAMPPQCSSSASAISDLQSPVSNLRSAEERGRGKPPLNLQLSGRFKVWQWMLDEWFERLGDQAEAFDVEAWLHDLDRKDKLLIPANTNWKWLDAQWWDEATRRGLVAHAAIVGGEDAVYAAIGKKGPSVRP